MQAIEFGASLCHTVTINRAVCLKPAGSMQVTLVTNLMDVFIANYYLVFYSEFLKSDSCIILMTTEHCKLI